MSEDVRIHGQLTEFLHELRCEACQQRNGKCILQESDEKCMLCADADRECVFAATVTVKGPKACFVWTQLLDRAKLPVVQLGGDFDKGIRSAFNKPSYPLHGANLLPAVAPRPADPLIANQSPPPIVIEKWSVVPATTARKNLWRESVSFDPESGEERHESGFHSRRTGRVIKPSSIRRHSPPFQPHVVSAQKESPLSNYSCHVCGMKARNASEWKKHQLRHTKPFVCEIAGCARQEGFSTKNDLERHSKSVHNIISNSTLDRNFRCAAKDCPKKEKVWLRLDNFRQHCHRIHSDQETEELIKRSELASSTDFVGGLGDVSHLMLRQSATDSPLPHKRPKSIAELPEIAKRPLGETEWRMPSINEIVSHAGTHSVLRPTSSSPPVRADVEHSDIAPTSTRSSTISSKPDLKILRPKPDEPLPQQDHLSSRSSPLKDTVMRDSSVIVLDSKNDMVEASTRGKRHLTESERQKVAKVRKSGACEECRKSKKRCTHSWIYSEYDGEKHNERSSESSPTRSMTRQLSSDSPSDIPTHNQHPLDGISFIVSIEALQPNYELEPVKTTNNGFWTPPDVCDAFFRGPITAFRWRNGFLGRIDVPATTGKAKDCLRCATVFTQMPSTSHVLAVDFDAELTSVKESSGNWKPLSFVHIKHRKSDAVVSSIENFGSEKHIAAPCPPHLRQVLPSIYDWQPELDGGGSHTTKPPIFAGFIGKMPLLIALAAFSALPSSLERTMVQCIRPGVWVPHSQDSGHRPERGMVVKIMPDPENPGGSDMSHLERLEQGDYGPFYGPNPYPKSSVQANSTDRAMKRLHD